MPRSWFKSETIASKPEIIEPLALGFEGEQWHPEVGMLFIPLSRKSGKAINSIAVTRGDGTNKNKFKLYMVVGGEFIEFSDLLMLAAKVHEMVAEHERLP